MRHAVVRGMLNTIINCPILISAMFSAPCLRNQTKTSLAVLLILPSPSSGPGTSSQKSLLVNFLGGVGEPLESHLTPY